jgi:hypothetical protein
MFYTSGHSSVLLDALKGPFGEENIGEKIHTPGLLQDGGKSLSSGYAIIKDVGVIIPDRSISLF